MEDIFRVLNLFLMPVCLIFKCLFSRSPVCFNQEVGNHTGAHTGRLHLVIGPCCCSPCFPGQRTGTQWRGRGRWAGQNLQLERNRPMRHRYHGRIQSARLCRPCHGLLGGRYYRHKPKCLKIRQEQVHTSTKRVKCFTKRYKVTGKAWDTSKGAKLGLRVARGLGRN